MAKLEIMCDGTRRYALSTMYFFLLFWYFWNKIYLKSVDYYLTILTHFLSTPHGSGRLVLWRVHRVLAVNPLNTHRIRQTHINIIIIYTPLTHSWYLKPRPAQISSGARVRERWREGREPQVPPSASLREVYLCQGGVSLRRHARGWRRRGCRRPGWETGREWEKRGIEDGGGGEPSLGWDHLHRVLCWEIMRAHKSSAQRRAGAPGEPCIRRVISVESGAGVCAKGLPHTVPPPLNSLP